MFLRDFVLIFICSFVSYIIGLFVGYRHKEIDEFCKKIFEK